MGRLWEMKPTSQLVVRVALRYFLTFRGVHGALRRSVARSSWLWLQPGRFSRLASFSHGFQGWKPHKVLLVPE